MDGKKKTRTYVTLNGITADPHIVRLIMDHLLNSFNEFLNQYPGAVDHIDGMMGIHNFYRAVLDHLAADTGYDGWHDLALGTFQEAIERRRKGGETNINYISSDDLTGE